MEGWDRDVALSFVDTLRELPCVYQRNTKEYRTNRKRFAAYDILLGRTKKVLPTVTMEHVKNMLTTVQKMYKIRMKLKNSNDASYKGEEDWLIPRLLYTRDVSFLAKQYDEETPVATISSRYFYFNTVSLWSVLYFML